MRARRFAPILFWGDAPAPPQTPHLSAGGSRFPHPPTFFIGPWPPYQLVIYREAGKKYVGVGEGGKPESPHVSGGVWDGAGAAPQNTIRANFLAPKWCAGEVTTAVRNGVAFIKLVGDSFVSSGQIKRIENGILDFNFKESGLTHRCKKGLSSSIGPYFALFRIMLETV